MWCSSKLYDKNMPVLGIATHLIPTNHVQQAVKKALEAGFRHIECKFGYKEVSDIVEVVNEFISGGVFTKEDVFLTAKMTIPVNLYGESSCLYEFFEESRKKIGLERIDLLLLEYPVPSTIEDKTSKQPKCRKKIKPSQTTSFGYTISHPGNIWPDFSEYRRHGLTCNIGLSNFTTEEVKKIMSVGWYMPTINRIDSSHFIISNELVDYCKTGITLASYNTLGSNAISKHSKLQPVEIDARIFEIGRRYKKTPAQIVVSYLIKIGTISREPLIQSPDEFDFKLKPKEMKLLDDCAYSLQKFFVYDAVS